MPDRAARPVVRLMLSVLAASVAAVTGLVAVGVPAEARGRAAAASVQVTFTAPDVVPTGSDITVTGSVTPNKAGRVVQLQSHATGEWTTIGTAGLSKRSAYFFTLHFTDPGASGLRVVLPARGAQDSSISPRRVVTAVEPGYDVGYPQCGATMPAGATFGIVGVDGGRPFDVNPCLAEQIAWARAAGKPAYYINTADPGAKLSDHWPTGQSKPEKCSASDKNSLACSYDYGWNAAKDSFQRARAAATTAGVADVTKTRWWLDVETNNTWQSIEYGEKPGRLANDTAALEGMRRYLMKQGVKHVGIYSTTHQWQRITGGVPLHEAPIWYAGVSGATKAAKRCSADFSFTGGPVVTVQFLRAGFDADHRC